MDIIPVMEAHRLQSLLKERGSAQVKKNQLKNLTRYIIRANTYKSYGNL